MAKACLPRAFVVRSRGPPSGGGAKPGLEPATCRPRVGRLAAEAVPASGVKVRVAPGNLEGAKPEHLFRNSWLPEVIGFSSEIIR